MMGLKKILLSLLCSVLLVGWTSAQDTTDTSQGSYFLSFVKKVYFNPTILLATQDFREQHNVRVLVLPDLNGAEQNQITGFERGMQKIIRFLIEGDDEGSIRFYFDAQDTVSPFSFVFAEELHCKFTAADKDSIVHLLNAPFHNATYNLNSHALFEASIEGALDYAGRCLQHVTAQCGEMPEHATTEINTKPLSISMHAMSGTKFDIDNKQFALLESHYAKAHDVFTDQDWYAPAKLMVAGESEPIAIAIDKHETLFKKQNIVFRTVYNNQVIPIEQSSTNDTIKLKLPADLPSGNPVEVVVKYTSTVDSIQYTVGFFMVYVYEPKEVKLNLLAANGYTIDEAAIANELKKVYDPVGVHFTIEKKEWMPDSEWARNIIIQNSGLLSNYPPHLGDWVNGVQELNDYDEEEYYLVFGLNTTELAGYMPRGRNIGFVFSGGTNPGKVAAHELGHGAFHLRHIFAEEELGESETGSTANLMDYVPNPRELYLHQWKFIDDPASVSWFGGDDEDGAITSCSIDLLTPFKEGDRFNFIKVNGKYISLPSTITRVSFSTLDRYIYTETGLQSDYIAPVGALVSFRDKDDKYYAGRSDGFFYDENNQPYVEDLTTYDSIEAGITCFVEVDPSKELYAIFFRAPSRFTVSATANPGGVTADNAWCIFGPGGSTTPGSAIIGEEFLISANVFITTARQGVLTGNKDVIRGESVYMSSDVVNFIFYRPDSNAMFLNNLPAPPPIKISFADFKIHHLFPTKSEYTNGDIIRYLMIKSIRKNELNAISQCIQSETYLDRETNLDMLQNIYVNCTTCVSEKAHLNELRSRTIYTMIAGAIKSSDEVVHELENLISINASASDLGSYLSGVDYCDTYGIPWELRKQILEKIIYDDGSWSVDSKSILGMLVKTCIDDDGSKMLAFFAESKFSKLGYMISSIDEWTDWNDAADVKDAMEATNHLVNHIIKNKNLYPQSTNHFVYSQTTYSTIELQNYSGIYPTSVLSVPDQTYSFNFPYTEVPIVLGTTSGTKVQLPSMNLGASYYGSQGAYEITTESGQGLYPITWDAATGKFKITQHFTMNEVMTATVIYAPGTTFPDEYIYSVNSEYSLHPYDLVDVVIGDNYGSLDLNKGQVIQLPVIVAYFLQESIHNANFSANFRYAINVVEIGAAIIAIATAPITLGSSLVIFAGVMASIDIGIQAERNKVGSSEEYNSEFYQTWDNIKMISDLGLGAVGVYKLGVYALKQGRSFVIAVAIRRAVRNTQLTSSINAMETADFAKRIIVSVQKGVTLEKTFMYGSTTSLFGRNTINGIIGFSDDVAVLSGQQGINVNTFKALQQKAFVDLTLSEQSIVNGMRNAIAMPDANTILQKTISKADIQKYLNGDYKEIGGFVTTAKDAKHLNTFEDIYHGMRLDYSGTKFALTDGSCGVIRYKTPNASSLTVPKSPLNGGVETSPMPFTGHGFTSGNMGRLGVPEWKSPAYYTPNEGAELWEVFSDGSEVLRGRFSIAQNKFIIVP